jgi:hypothetical protein
MVLSALAVIITGISLIVFKIIEQWLNKQQ